MDALLKSAACRMTPFAIVAIVLAGCGGHSSGATAPPPGVPVISNLIANVSLGLAAQPPPGHAVPAA